MGALTDRMQRLGRTLAERGLGAVLLPAPEHLSNVQVRYLTGFSGSSSYFLGTPDRAWLLTDFRYVEAAQAEARGYEVVRHERPYVTTLAKVAGDAGIGSIGFEADRVPVAMLAAWQSAMPGVAFVPIGTLMEELRIVKDAEEIAAIRRAAVLADQALEELLPTIRGRREMDFAVALEHRMRELGLDGPGFATIVASGERGSLPHGQPTERVVQDGDMVTVDFGGMSDGYRSDETVTFGVGQVAPRLREIFDLVQRAQAAGIAAVRPGIRASEVDRACREMIVEAGYGDAFGHGAGHGVGLDIHERPFAAREPEPDKDDVLAAGMTITVEPGIYLPGVGGARLEDTLVVTADGGERLTTVPKVWRTV
jgi:Xaa-Pro aminopeptidase